MTDTDQTNTTDQQDNGTVDHTTLPAFTVSDLELDAMSDEEIAQIVLDNTGTASNREGNIEFLRSIRPAPTVADVVEETDQDSDEQPSLEERLAVLEEKYRLLELRTRHFT